MKAGIVLTVMLLGACGGTVEKDGINSDSSTNGSSNGQTNGSTNSSSTNNTVIIINGSTNSASNAQNSMGNAQTTCDTRAECGAAQECVDGLCTDHLMCSDGGGGNGSGCDYDWSCDDGKSYRMSCVLLDDIETVACECLVNDVAIAEFEGLALDVCEFEIAHRAANDECGWLVPAF